MNETIIFLIKIFIASLILSFLIKYLGPLLSLSPTNLNALIIVMIVPVIVTVFLTKKMLNIPSDS